MENTKCNINT